MATDVRERARRVLADLRGMPEGQQVEHLAAVMQAEQMQVARRRRQRRAPLSSEGRMLVETITHGLRRGAALLSGTEPDAALALREHAGRIEQRWARS